MQTDTLKIILYTNNIPALWFITVGRILFTIMISEKKIRASHRKTAGKEIDACKMSHLFSKVIYYTLQRYETEKGMLKVIIMEQAFLWRTCCDLRSNTINLGSHLSWKYIFNICWIFTYDKIVGDVGLKHSPVKSDWTILRNSTALGEMNIEQWTVIHRWNVSLCVCVIKNI